MAGGTVHIHRGHLVQDQRTGILLKGFGHLHPVRSDPFQRDLLFQICHLLHIHRLGNALVRVVGDSLEGDHAAALACKGRSGGGTANGVGLVHIRAAGQMAGAALQGGELDGTALALQLVVDELRKVTAGAAEDGLVAKSVQLAGGGHQIAQVSTVCGLYALAGCDDNVGLYPLQLVHPGKELVLIKGHFRQQDQVGAFAVLAACQTGRTGQPACVAAHDLGHRHAADVIHRGVADDFL